MSPATYSSTSNSQPPPDDLFPYETISYSGKLEFLDRSGTVAVFKRRQTIRVNAPRLSVFLDRIWGDGVVFGDYWTGALEIVEVVRSRIGWVAILSLPRSFRRGETVELRTERRIVGGFTQSVEHWDSTMYAPTKWLSLEISGPAASRLKWPTLSAPRGDEANIQRDRDALTLIVREPEAHARYRLQWNW